MKKESEKEKDGRTAELRILPQSAPGRKTAKKTVAAAVCCVLAVCVFFLLFFPPMRAVAAENKAENGKLSDFTDDFESYAVDGEFIENDAGLTSKWENNVFKGGEPVGMDAHIRNVGKIGYESGNSGNKVLHLENTKGADTFFYMGPAGDYRVKDLTATFRVKFLTQNVSEKSWVGLSFRKRANVYYTGTNNLLFAVQRYVSSDTATVHSYAVIGGGSITDLSKSGDLFGDLLTVERREYKLPHTTAGEDSEWLNLKYVVSGRNYKLYIGETQVLSVTFGVKNFDYYGFASLNCCTANIFIDDFKIKVDDAGAPPVIPPLDAPVISVDTDKKAVLWSAVDGASSYAVTVNGETSVVDFPSYKLAQLTKAGDYAITVSAISDDPFEFKDSPPSNSVTYTVGSGEAGGCGGKAGAGVPLIAAVLSAAGCAAALNLFFRKRRIRR